MSTVSLKGLPKYLGSFPVDRAIAAQMDPQSIIKPPSTGQLMSRWVARNMEPSLIKVHALSSFS